MWDIKQRSVQENITKCNAVSVCTKSHYISEEIDILILFF